MIWITTKKNLLTSNCQDSQVALSQCSSSLPSGQSFSPSHCHLAGIQVFAVPGQWKLLAKKKKKKCLLIIINA